MGLTELPKPVISLVHHVELNKAGWWERAVERLVLAVLWLIDEPQPEGELPEILSAQLNLKVNAEKITHALESLRKKDQLVSIPPGKVKIAEQARRTLADQVDEAEKLDDAVQSLFAKSVNQRCPEVDGFTTWNTFNEEFLLPLISDLGASTYSVMSGEHVHIAPKHFKDLLEKYPPDKREDLREAIQEFLDPKEQAVRSYVLRHLNAYFYTIAGHLDEQTLRALSSLREEKRHFTLFVDTNFLFSLLNIHENPANEAASALAQLVREVQTYVGIAFYVLPPTLDEAKRVLIASKLDLAGVRPYLNLARAARRAGLSGVAAKYILECEKAGEPIDLEAYFNPYLRNLVQVCRRKGVELYNENTTPYKTRQDVVDDINNQLEFYESRAEERSYGQVEHDMIVWHFVRDRRDEYVESALTARYWILTVDYGLLGFDSARKRAGGGPVPLCVHPSTLIQLLQLWVPRTTAVEEALVGTLRMPLFFEEFDVQAERVTLKILKTLSRYQNVQDLDEETVSATLMDDAFRARIDQQEDEDENLALVTDAIVKENARKAERVKEAEREAKTYASQLEDTEKKLKEVYDELHSEAEKRQESERALGEQREQGDKLLAKVRELESTFKTQGRESDQRRFIVKYAFILGGAVIGGGLLSWLLAPAMSVSYHRFGIFALALIFFAVEHFAHEEARECESISDTTAFSGYARVRWVIQGLAIAVGAVIFLVEAYRAIMPLFEQPPG